MRLRLLLLILVLVAVPAIAGCGEDEDPATAERLSRPGAIERIDAICRRSRVQLERAGPEPVVGSGSWLALARYDRWHARASAVVEAGLRRVERVPIPGDARAGEIRAYVSFARESIRAGRGVLRAVQAGDEAGGDRLFMAMESSSDQASFAARRYGLRQCGG